MGNLREKLGLSPEERLVLACARLHLSPAQREELDRLLAGQLRWDQVWLKAQWHGVTPLLFHHLRQLESWPRLPAEVTGLLKGAYLANTAKNLYFQAELKRVLDAVNAQGVPVILLKGAALAGIVYGDIGLRSMSDLDLLVSEQQLRRAQEAIKGLGYFAVGSPTEQDETEKHHRHLPGLMREGSPVLVEVHRHIVRRDSGLHFDIGGFWARSQKVSLVNRQALVLAPEDLLIHLCLNFFLDRRFRSVAALRQLCDIAESVKHYQEEIDWQLFIANVQAYKLTGPVGCVLYLTQELLGAPVSEAVARQLWPQGFDSSQVERFLRRRVLDTRDWVAHGLAQPDKEYRPGRILVAAFHRLIPARRYMARQYTTPMSGIQGIRAYLSRIGEGFLILGRAVIRPREAIEDLSIDRWHHSLYRGQQKAQGGSS